MQTINKQVKANETLTELFPLYNGKMEFEVYENACLNACFLMTGQQVDLSVRLMGKNAKANIKAVYLSSQDKDNHLSCEVIHCASETYSNQLIKGIAAKGSRTDFYGVIRIPHACQKCEGAQIHKALLLSDDAVVKATPELEIYADDVKCAHGSTVGTLDKSYLFYLQSRGIDEKTARQMLMKAFLLSDMPEAFEQQITEWMDCYE